MRIRVLCFETLAHEHARRLHRRQRGTAIHRGSHHRRIDRRRRDLRGRSVIVAASARVGGDILARDITVFGESAGQLIATEVVDVRATAAVTGQIVSPRFILDEAAFFKGRVAPQMLEAAIRVAHFQRRGAKEPQAERGVR